MELISFVDPASIFFAISLAPLLGIWVLFCAKEKKPPATVKQTTTVKPTTQMGPTPPSAAKRGSQIEKLSQERKSVDNPEEKGAPVNKEIYAAAAKTVPAEKGPKSAREGVKEAASPADPKKTAPGEKSKNIYENDPNDLPNQETRDADKAMEAKTDRSKFPTGPMVFKTGAKEKSLHEYETPERAGA